MMFSIMLRKYGEDEMEEKKKPNQKTFLTFGLPCKVGIQICEYKKTN